MAMASSHLLERSGLDSTFQLSRSSWAQLEPGRFEVRYGVMNASPVELSVRHFNIGFRSHAEIAPQRFMLGIVADARTQARWFGSRVDSDSIAATKSFVDVSTEGPGAFYQISVDEKELARLFPSAPDALDLIELTQGVRLAQDRTHAALLRSSMHRLFSITDEVGATMMPRGLPTKVIYGTLVPLMTAALERFDRHAVEPTKCLTRRLAAVRSCESFMREHVDATITLLDLSCVSGMRSRSLINAFEAVTGFSPMDYLKRLRLDGVRRALRRADKAETRIIDVATDWGFWHMGHFTSDYRAMFGETPSRTLLDS